MENLNSKVENKHKNHETNDNQEIQESTSLNKEGPSDEALKNTLFFSTKKFSDLNLTSSTVKALSSKNYLYATEIQAECIPLAMKGKDLMGTAKTGSGKSLAFLIPAVELLFRTDFSQNQGTGVIILTPTRELATQLYEVAKDLLSINRKTCSLIIGGAYRKKEAAKLQKGVNLLIATPGRLLDHLKNTEGFNYHNLCMLIIDEADAILKNGFEDELKEILDILPDERQTLLFSATLSKKVENLISLSLKDPIYIDKNNLDKSQNSLVASNLEHGYTIVKPDKKFLFLYTFIKKNLKKKIMVFFSTCMEVKFYSYLLNYVNMTVKDIHGDLKQTKRNQVYYEFCNSDAGVLLCTDIAQRGLDFPEVDWIIQYDPPNNPSEYIHRVGRTARGAYAKGKALLVLLPNEVKFIDHIEKSKIKDMKEFEFPEEKLIDIQDNFENIVESNMALESLAKDAYKSYIFSYLYTGSKLPDVFDLEKLERTKVCKSFGFKLPPPVYINKKRY
jgi:ATP-dependent RNA helicase DDX18/HAS1